MEAAEALETLELSASDQWGIISTQQAEQVEVTRLQLSRFTDRGLLQRARRGIYYLPSTQYDASTEVRAAWISLEPKLFISERWASDKQIVVSHESAAVLHGIGDLIPQQYMFSSTFRKQTSQPDIKIHTNRSFDETDIISIDGLPVTSAERTLEDLAAQQIERNYLATAVVDGLAKEGVRFSSLAERLHPFAKFYGSASGRDLLIAFQDEEASLETKHDAIERALGSSTNLNTLFEYLMPSFQTQFNEQVRSMSTQALAGTSARRMDELNKSLTKPMRSAMEQLSNRNVQAIKSAISPSVLSQIKGARFIPPTIELLDVSRFGLPAMPHEDKDKQ